MEGETEGFALVEGHEQQIALAGFVPEHAFAVDPGGVVAQDPKGRFDFGAAVAAVDAQRHRQGPGKRVEAAIGALGQQVQQLAQIVAPGGGLPEQGKGIGQGPPALAGAAQAVGVVEVEQAGAGAEGMDLGQRLGPSNGLRGLFMEPPR